VPLRRGADEPDAHLLLTLVVGSPENPKVPAVCAKLEGSFDIDDDVAHLSGGGRCTVHVDSP
jgi:hypothetical protein